MDTSIRPRTEADKPADHLTEAERLAIDHAYNAHKADPLRVDQDIHRAHSLEMNMLRGAL